MAVIDRLIPEHKAERAHTRNTAWSRNCQQFAHILLCLFCLLFFLPLQPTTHFVVSLSLFLLSPGSPFMFPLHSPFWINIAHYPFMQKSKAAPVTSRGHHSSLAYILVLYLHGHWASKQIQYIVFHREIWRLVKNMLTESYVQHSSYLKPLLSTSIIYY